VTDSADLTHDVLLRVAEFLRKLPTDQLAGLAAGTAKLEVVPNPGKLPSRVRGVPPAEPTVTLPKPATEIGQAMAGQPDRASAARYLDELKLTQTQLRGLATALGIAVASKATKTQARDTIVQWTVGRRVDAAVIGRPAPRPR
jgi:hypothetical protein